jgi:hypothetical protein
MKEQQSDQQQTRIIDLELIEIPEYMRLVTDEEYQIIIGVQHTTKANAQGNLDPLPGEPR